MELAQCVGDKIMFTASEHITVRRIFNEMFEMTSSLTLVLYR